MRYTKPRARVKDMVMQEVRDELLIYDIQRVRTFSLNPPAAWVWQQADGQTDIEVRMGWLRSLSSILRPRVAKPNPDTKGKTESRKSRRESKKHSASSD